MKFDLPRAPIGPEEPRYHALRTWRLAVVVCAGAGSLAGARRRPAFRGLGCAQLGPRHPRHQLGARGGLAARCKAAGGARLTPRHAATRPAPNPRASHAHLDLITQEKKEVGDLVVRRARTGHAPPPPPAAATAAAKHLFGAPHQGPARHRNHVSSSPLRYCRTTALPPDSPRLAASPPPCCPTCRRSEFSRPNKNAPSLGWVSPTCYIS